MAGSGVDRYWAGSSTSTRRQHETAGQDLWPRSGTRQGRTVDFKNTVIIFTSNLGTQDISKAVGLGFAQSNDAASDYERMKNKVNDELKKHFRPEFLNRIDDLSLIHI